MVAFGPETIILTLACGALVGLLLGTFGGGGSVLAAPLLLYVVGVSDPHVAIGTSAAAVAATALFNLFGHWRGGRVKWPCAIVFAAAGLIGSLIGSSVAKTIHGDILLVAFSVAMAAIGFSMLRRPKSAGDPDVHLTPAFTMRLAPLGLAVGFAAGFFGIGGGFLIVPGLIAATGMTMSAATASSLVSVVIFGAATSSNYALSGYVDLKLAALLVGGGIIGGIGGLFIAKLLAGRQLVARRGFAVFVIIVAAYVAYKAITAMTGSG